jgi:hypothetical protein
MDLPPYREMPPEVRFRLRGRVLPALNRRPSARVPYMVAAAIVVVAAVALALLMSPARNGAPPAGLQWTSPTNSLNLRLVDMCQVEPGDWQTGAYLQLSNGDAVQLGIKDRGILGVCKITTSHPTTQDWFTMVPWQPGHYWTSFQAVLGDGLVYGTVGPEVRSVKVDGVPATVANGTFVAEIGMKRSVTVTTTDAQGKDLDQGTVS